MDKLYIFCPGFYQQIWQQQCVSKLQNIRGWWVCYFNVDVDSDVFALFVCLSVQIKGMYQDSNKYLCTGWPCGET